HATAAFARLAMRARRPPRRFPRAPPPDQCAQIGGVLGRPSRGGDFPPPVPTEAGPMPTYESLGPDDRDGPEDRWEPSIQLDQEQAIPIRELNATAQHYPRSGRTSSDDDFRGEADQLGRICSDNADIAGAPTIFNFDVATFVPPGVLKCLLECR